MNKIILSLLLLFGIASADKTKETKNIISNYVQAWQPLMITLNDGVLIIAFNQNRITNDIFLSIMQNGICTSASLEKWSGVKQIGIMNKHAEQGFVFKGGYDECKQSSNYKGKQKEIFLLGKSRLY